MVPSTPTSSGHARRDSSSPSSSSGGVVNTTSVKVVLRIRPATTTEAVPVRFQRIVVNPLNSITLQVESPTPTAKSSKSTFTFDHVIGPDQGQSDVYERTNVDGLVDGFVGGMNTTILAYGQTSSGKSYTMGTDRPDLTEDGVASYLSDNERLGITPRAVGAIFERMKGQTTAGTTFSAKCSYVEIYNEDLIDLLGEPDVRREVSIREDKGTIIWSGLREVAVKSVGDVMKALNDGSALRQTNATDMNAQSSRSHAIFSLTLTQRRYTGTRGPPSPQPPGSPSGPRKSAIPRVTSPTPGSRSQTPTSDRPGSRIGGLRPPSMIGSLMAGATGRANSPALGSASEEEERTESWVTVTSKFHFVDLAGSERIKKTTAQGERVKEGISINSGLHALGNVISALGDPARARQTTHIPYRDSKLTRLLQDSLGGNTHTMMVACVSPTEFNLNETLSTIKYANRARNIKNRVEVNEVEVGWDDVDYLQRTITKLRAEMGALKSGEGVKSISEGHEGGAMEEKYAELTQKVSSLKLELAAVNALGGGGGDAAALSLSREDFTRAVEPIVEEYEKSLSALEGQLSLTQAALKHAEEEMAELEARIDEEARTNEASAVLIGELKSRIGKLAEREATTETYVRDLEAKLKDYGDQDESYGTAVSDLRKEITKNREQAEATEQYIKDLERRLATAEEGNTTLKRQIEVLERDVARREETYRELESRLSLLDTSGDHKQLLAEIDERDKKVLDLERSLDELQTMHTSTTKEAARLRQLADAEKEAKEELQSRVRTLERRSLSAATIKLPTQVVGTPPQPQGEDSLPSRRSSLINGYSTDKADEVDSALVNGLESRIAELEATHDRTLAELEIANAKYRESLKEIEDLHTQVQETKLIRSEQSDQVPPSPSIGMDDSEEHFPFNGSPAPTATTTTTPSRTPRSRRSMPLSPQHRLSFLGRGQGASATSHLRSASLSQELSSAQGSQFSSPPSPRPQSPSFRDVSVLRDVFSSPTHERTYEQMKGEVMKLQQTLSEREEEISSLETTLFHLRGTASTAPSSVDGGNLTPQLVPIPPTTFPPYTPDAIHMSPMVPRSPMLRGSPNPDTMLSPKTRAAFDALKAELDSDETAALAEDSSARLDDLMRSMAKKESAHREKVDQLEDQLLGLTRQHEELKMLSRDQVVNMSSEIERLRALLESRPEASHYEGQISSLQKELDAKHAEIVTTRQNAEQDIERTKTFLLAEHQRGIDVLVAEHSAALLEIKNEQGQELQRSLDEHQQLLTQRDTDHKSVVASHALQHEEVLRLRTLDHASALAAKSDEMEAALHQCTKEHEESARRVDAERTALASSEKDALAATLQQLKDDHNAATSAREEDFTAQLAKARQDHNAALLASEASHTQAIAQLQEQLDKQGLITASLQQLNDEHRAGATKREAELAAQLEHAAQVHDAALLAAEDSYSKAIAQLQEAHDSLATSLQQLEDEHRAVVSKREEEHTAQLKKAAHDHDAALLACEDSHSKATAQLQEEQGQKDLLAVSAQKLYDDHHAAASKREEEYIAKVEKATQDHQAALLDLGATHSEAIAQMSQDHDAALAGREEDFRAQLEKAALDHSVALLARDGTHSSAVAQLQQEHDTRLADNVEAHTKALDRLREEHDASICQLGEKHSRASAQLLADHAAALSTAAQAHEAQLTTLKNTQSSELSRAREEHAAEIKAKDIAHAGELSALRQEHLKDVEAKTVANSAHHAAAVQELEQKHRDELGLLSSSHSKKLAELALQHEATVASMLDSHGAALTGQREIHDQALADLTQNLGFDISEHSRAIDEARSETFASLTEQHNAAVVALTSTHESSLSALRSEHDTLLSQLEASHATAMSQTTADYDTKLKALTAKHDNLVSVHSTVKAQRDELLGKHEAAQSELSRVQTDQDGLLEQFAALAQTHDAADAAQLAKIATLEASLATAAARNVATQSHESTVAELQDALDALSTLEKALVESQEDRERLVTLLQKVQAAGDEERAKIGSLAQEIEGHKATIARLDEELTKSGKDRESLSVEITRLAGAEVGQAGLLGRARSPTQDGTAQRAALINGFKAPPPTPPPSMPPPPLPASFGTRQTRSPSNGSMSNSLSTFRNSTATIETPGTSLRPSSNGTESLMGSQWTQKLDEQDAQIAKLSKQLSHCESDLQANIELVNTLESALNDSERNLRKARQQMGDLARERDSFLSQNEELRRDIQIKHNEAETMRDSVLQVESQYHAARQRQEDAERAAARLDGRLKEVNKNKSKFACF